jgi:hypothetical protein
VREKLTVGAVWLRDEHGMKVGISGMALGVDTWWAHAVLAAGLELHAYIPFETQADRWTPVERAEWTRLRGLATVVRVVGPNPRDRREAVRLLHARNDAMLAESAAVVAVLLAGKVDGGTASAVRKAEQRGLSGVHLEPTARRVRVVESGGWLAA